MLEDSLDPRPGSDVALELMFGSTEQRLAVFTKLDLSRFWDDRQSDWTNLSNVLYWLDHAT